MFFRVAAPLIPISGRIAAGCTSPCLRMQRFNLEHIGKVAGPLGGKGNRQPGSVPCPFERGSGAYQLDTCDLSLIVGRSRSKGFDV